MNIDIVVSSLRGGGAERVAVNMANYWANKGVNVRLLIQTDLCDIDYKPNPLVSVQSFHERNKFLRAIKLRRIIKYGNANTIIAIQSNMSIVVSLLSFGIRKKFIGTEHNTPSRSVWGVVWKKLRPYAYRRLYAVTVLTNPAVSKLKAIVPEVNVHAIPNAVSLPLDNSGTILNIDDVINDKSPFILAVGRLSESKGFDRLIKCFKHYSEINKDLKLVIIGEGHLRTALEKQVADLGLTHRIMLPGRAGNMSEWYSRAKLLVMTSRWEGMPMVLIEGMAHGLPAVVTDFPDGPRDVILNNHDGIIIPEFLPEEAPEEWGNYIDLALDDSNYRRLKENSIGVINKFSEDQVMQRWDHLVFE